MAAEASRLSRWPANCTSVATSAAVLRTGSAPDGGELHGQAVVAACLDARASRRRIDRDERGDDARPTADGEASKVAPSVVEQMAAAALAALERRYCRRDDDPRGDGSRSAAERVTDHRAAPGRGERLASGPRTRVRVVRGGLGGASGWPSPSGASPARRRGRRARSGRGGEERRRGAPARRSPRAPSRGWRARTLPRPRGGSARRRRTARSLDDRARAHRRQAAAHQRDRFGGRRLNDDRLAHGDEPDDDREGRGGPYLGEADDDRGRTSGSPPLARRAERRPPRPPAGA